MNGLKPNGHEEQTVEKGLILLTAHDVDMLGPAIFKTIDAKKITFNDLHVTYLDEENKYHYEDLTNWRIKVYPYGQQEEPEEEPEEQQTDKQISIFDILGG